MENALAVLRVNAGRFRTRFDALSAIGATPDGGLDRPAFSIAHRLARGWYFEQAEQAGLEIRVDGAGNHSALLRCGPAGGPTLLLGSHLDSVPNGGRFDGALGVVAALEVLQVVKEAGFSLGAHLEAVDLTDEEGHFANFLGSLGMTGMLDAGHIENPRGGRERFRRALEDAGMDEGTLLSAGRDPRSLAGYLELHIEQGPRLAEHGDDIGIVTNIVGIRSFKIRFLGRADHAGTTPMDRRLDATLGASAFSLAVRERVMSEYPRAVATVGNMVFEPGVFNVVPRSVVLSMEFRAEDETALDAMETELMRLARAEAGRFGLGLDVQMLDSSPPASMNAGVQEAIGEAAEMLGLRYTFLHSGAGHDAQCLAPICPTGMIFVPSVSGFSHSAKELTSWQDCVNGANTLLQAALLLAR
jgi:N-carbamoyl-L-amino-acid hydrolase